MTTKSKRTVFVSILCVLFLVTSAATYCILNGTNPLAVFEQPQEITFPDAPSAAAEIGGISWGAHIYNSINFEFPDSETVKELFELETWVNNYQYNKDLLYAPWSLTVNYHLKDGGIITRSYSKSAWNEVLENFVEEHKQYITDKAEIPNA